MRKGFLMGVAAAAAAAAAAGAVSAQQAPAPAPGQAQAAAMNPKAVVAEVRRLIAENYVLPEKRAAIDAALAKGEAAGRYAVSDPVLLAARINEDLEAAAHDKHLGIKFNPGEAEMLGRHRADEGHDGPEFLRMAQVRNHGFTEMKVLEGNVRYVAMDGFIWTGAKSAEAYDNAMRFLKDGDAAIVDIRRNGGGSPEAVQYLISHFMEPDRHLVTFHMGGRTDVDTLSTLPELPAGRMVGKPLYVLTSGRSASAAEEFAGHIGGFKVGELVGETTAGAGFRNNLYPVPGGFVLSVSVGRAVLASTGKDWEGLGIPPTVKVAADRALDVAHARAAKTLAAKATGFEKGLFEGLAAVLAAKAEPVAPALPLAAYAGRFGERSIILENGRLVFERENGPRHGLVPMGANLFGFDDGDPLTRVQFEVTGGKAGAFDLIRGDGSRVKAVRD